MKFPLLLIVFSVIYSVFAHPKDYIEEVFKWKKVEFDNLPKSENSWVGPYRYYIPENVDVDSIGYDAGSGVFIATFARLRPGAPITVGAFCAEDYSVGSSPKFWGFPNYELNTLWDSDFEGGSAEDATRKSHHSGGIYYVHQTPNYEKPSAQEIKRIITVFHISIDEKCKRVFFMDFGQLQYYQNATYIVHKPALWVVGLPVNGCESRNFPIIRRTEVPNRIADKAPFGYMYVTFDYQSENSCDDLFLYIANAFYSHLVVYDYKRDEFWSFDHETFHPVIAESNLIFNRTYNYDMQLGIHSIALGYPDENGDRTAYYTSVASTAQYAVSTKILKSRRKSPANFKPDDFRIMGHRGSNYQPLKTLIDLKRGLMFNTEVQASAVRCWNINKPLNPDNIHILHKSDKYTFSIQAFIDSRDYLWFGTTHVPVLYTSDVPLDLSVVNSRVFRVKVDDFIRGTYCATES